MTRTRSKERAEFLADIITCAVEGGTGYWAQVSQYQWINSFEDGRVMVVCGERQGDEARATLHEMNDDETATRTRAWISPLTPSPPVSAGSSAAR